MEYLLIAMIVISFALCGYNVYLYSKHKYGLNLVASLFCGAGIAIECSALYLLIQKIN